MLIYLYWFLQSFLFKFFFLFFINLRIILIELFLSINYLCWWFRIHKNNFFIILERAQIIFILLVNKIFLNLNIKNICLNLILILNSLIIFLAKWNNCFFYFIHTFDLVAHVLLYYLNIFKWYLHFGFQFFVLLQDFTFYLLSECFHRFIIIIFFFKIMISLFIEKLLMKVIVGWKFILI